MQPYITIFGLTLKEYSVYRLNFILWRVRRFVQLLIIFLLWYAVFDTQSSFGSYPKSEFLSYILFSNLVSNFVFGTRTYDIAGEINDGKIINILLKPISFFRYYLTRDLADKTLNTLFAFIEVFIVIILFKIPLFTPTNIPVFLIFLLNGLFITFFTNLMLSFIGFWTTETWAPQFIFFVTLSFLTGSYFPLDILPPLLYKLLLLTPFPYFFYIPTKILIGSSVSIFSFEMLISVIYVFVSFKLAMFMWKKGNMSFSFWGR